MYEAIDIVTILEQSPAKLAILAEDVRQKRTKLDIAKHNCKVARAKATVEAATKAKNQKVLEAIVEFDEEVMTMERKVIAAHANFENAEIEHRKQYDYFVSARKLAGLDQKELRALYGAHVDMNTGEVTKYQV